ncbi:unnamed protein product [Auanema sp. JU1783]|nr:unnamed protein product [Auanema sp. JU1783]
MVREHVTSGASEVFNQPWSLPYRYAYKTIEELEKLNKHLIFSNYTYSKGLGNLMFQMASLYSIATGHNAQIVIPQSNLLLRAFTLSEDIIVVEDDLMNEVLTSSKPFMHLRNCCQYKPVSGIPFNPKSPRKVFLGYFQNSRYFHPKYSNDLQHLFMFLPEVKEKASNFLRNCMFEYAIEMGHDTEGNPDDQHILVDDNPLDSQTTVIGVHARHGIDIRLNSRNTAHGHVSAPINYYQTTMQLLKKQNPRSFFVICSDDMKWARKTFTKKEFGPIYFCPGEWREVDMAVLSMSDWIIQSTGTFGWWASYLSQYQNQIVYYSDWPRPNSLMDKMINKTEYFVDTWLGLPAQMSKLSSTTPDSNII